MEPTPAEIEEHRRRIMYDPADPVEIEDPAEMEPTPAEMEEHRRRIMFDLTDVSVVDLTEDSVGDLIDDTVGDLFDDPVDDLFEDPVDDYFDDPVDYFDDSVDPTPDDLSDESMGLTLPITDDPADLVPGETPVIIMEMPMQYVDPFDDSRMVKTIRSNMEENIKRIEARKANDEKLLKHYSKLKKLIEGSHAESVLKRHAEYYDKDIFDTCNTIRSLECNVNGEKPLNVAATIRVACEICQNTHCGETVVYMQCRHNVCTTCMSRLTQCICPFCRKPFRHVYTFELDGTDEWKMTTYRLMLHKNVHTRQNDNLFIEITNYIDKPRKRKCNHNKYQNKKRSLTPLDKIQRFLEN